MTGSDRTWRYISLIFLDITFGETLTILTHLKQVQLDWLLLVALIGASSLAGRALAYMGIFEWVRAPFTKVVPHSSGAGEDVEPGDHTGLRRVIAELLSCPICAGTWSALGLMCIYILMPATGRVLIFTLGAAGYGGVLSWLSESLEWTKHLARETTGAFNRYNKSQSANDRIPAPLMGWIGFDEN
jgi:hypothetical protein